MFIIILNNSYWMKDKFLNLIKTVKNTSFYFSYGLEDYYPQPTPEKPRKLFEVAVMINVAKYVLLPLFGVLDFECSKGYKGLNILG